ncbi:MAG: hypothetical protein Q4B01_02140 [Eubacteriales bacterium]|nr:hypothetical protein [Eubacteriales bacterium]
MKRRISLTLPLFFFLFSLSGCGYAGPEKAVREELNLIRGMNTDTITSFLTHEEGSLFHEDIQENVADIAEAIKLFYKDFKFKILSSSLSEDGSTSTVHVQITNLDAEQLAKDLCRGMIESSLTSSSETDVSLAACLSMMQQYLTEHSYDRKTTEIDIQLTKKDEEWYLVEDAALADGLTGGLVAFLNDRYLLSPKEALDITLSHFSDFTAVQWKSYLNVNDIFQVNSDLSEKLDGLLLEQISSLFSYQIGESRIDGDTAEVTLYLTSLDLEPIMQTYRASLLDYAKTTESIRASEDELTQKTGEILMEALNTKKQSTVHTIQVPLYNNGHFWVAVLNDSFTDALLGGISGAVEALD